MSFDPTSSRRASVLTVLAIVLSLCLLPVQSLPAMGAGGPPGAGGASAAPAAAAPTFRDVPATDWAYEQIEGIYQQQITTGCAYNAATGERRFCPDGTVTRREMALFLARAAGLGSATPATPSFNDVPPSDWGYGGIEAVQGQWGGMECAANAATGETRFCPDRVLSRREIALMLVRARGLDPYTPPAPTFSDVPASDPSFGWIEQLYQQQITTGCAYNAATGERRYCADATMSRREMAVLLQRTFSTSTSTSTSASVSTTVNRLALLARYEFNSHLPMGNDDTKGDDWYTTYYTPRFLRATARISYTVGDVDDAGRPSPHLHPDWYRTVVDPKAYSGWDLFATPGEGYAYWVNDPNWITLTLRRPAKLAVVLPASERYSNGTTGGKPAPAWLAANGWVEDLNPPIIADGAGNHQFRTYTKSVPAGATTIGGPCAANPCDSWGLTSEPYYVLIGESDGKASPAPSVPTGQTAPVPGNYCPKWVHDQYVTTGPDGQTYPTWHPQQDPVYGCYFGHEHGTDPEIIRRGFKPPFGYADAVMHGHAGMTSEGHEGFKFYAVDEPLGENGQPLTGVRLGLLHHFGTSNPIGRVCNRFHTLDFFGFTKDLATGQYVNRIAEYEMADFGSAVDRASNQPYNPPPGCTNGVYDGRRTRMVNNKRDTGTGLYEPWSALYEDPILGRAQGGFSFNTLGRRVCNDATGVGFPNCDKPWPDPNNPNDPPVWKAPGVRTGVPRWMVLEAQPRYERQPGMGKSATFYTDPMGQTYLQASSSNAVKQYWDPKFPRLAIGAQPTYCFTRSNAAWGHLFQDCASGDAGGGARASAV